MCPYVTLVPKNTSYLGIDSVTIILISILLQKPLVLLESKDHSETDPHTFSVGPFYWLPRAKSEAFADVGRCLTTLSWQLWDASLPSAVRGACAASGQCCEGPASHQHHTTTSEKPAALGFPPIPQHQEAKIFNIKPLKTDRKPPTTPTLLGFIPKEGWCWGSASLGPARGHQIFADPDAAALASIASCSSIYSIKPPWALVFQMPGRTNISKPGGEEAAARADLFSQGWASPCESLGWGRKETRREKRFGFP